MVGGSSTDDHATAARDVDVQSDVDVHSGLGNGAGIRRPKKTLYQVWRHSEMVSSTPILVLSLVSDLRPSAWANSSSSPVHCCFSFFLLFFTAEDSANHNPPNVLPHFLSES